MCAVFLDRVTPGRSAMKVVSRSCSAAGKSALAVPDSAADTALVTVFADQNYLGGSFTYYDTHGNGTCDATGYSFDDVAENNAWLNGISSMRGYDRCTAAEIYTTINRQGSPCFSQESPADGGPIPYVGDVCNDHVRSFRIWAR